MHVGILSLMAIVSVYFYVTLTWNMSKLHLSKLYPRRACFHIGLVHIACLFCMHFLLATSLILSICCRCAACTSVNPHNELDETGCGPRELSHLRRDVDSTGKVMRIRTVKLCCLLWTPLWSVILCFTLTNTQLCIRFSRVRAEEGGFLLNDIIV